MSSLLSLVLRGITSIVRFAFVIVLARVLSPDDVGVYSVFSAALIITTFIVGLDFYIHTNREIAASEPQDTERHLGNTLALYIAAYALLLPIVAAIAVAFFVPVELLGYFLLICVLDHLSQEASRLFFALRLPIAANWVIFFRLASWSLLVTAIALADSTAVTLNNVFLFWLGGAFVTCLHSARVLHKEGIALRPFKHLDIPWLKNGLVVAFPFLVSTVALRITEYGDRFFIKTWMSDAQLGAYAFYASIAGVSSMVAYTGVMSLLYPELIRHHKAGDQAALSTTYRKMCLLSIATIGVTAALTTVLVPFITGLTGKAIYQQYHDVFYLLIIAYSISGLALLPHFYLYARSGDRWIYTSTIAVGLLSLLLNYLLVPRLGLAGAAWAVILSSTVLLIAKGTGAMRIARA